MLTKYIGLCLGRRAGRHPSTKKYYTNLSEKSECNDQYENPSREAAELVDNLFKGFKQEYPELKSFGYWQRLAKLVLERLEKTLQASPPMSKVMADAFQRSKSEAQAIGDFVHDHPIIMTVIALGILVLLAPWVIEALGFGAAGPVEGSFAAAWQSIYEGLVPARSLFAYFQRLGMTWKIVPKQMRI